MQTGQFAESGFFKLYVERLTLVYLNAPVCSHLYNPFLLHFLHCFVEFLDLLGDTWNLLHWAVGVHEFLAQSLVPNVEGYQVVDEILIDLDELPWEHPADLTVGVHGFNGLIVAHDLGCGSCRHGCKQQTVSNSKSFDFTSKCFPVLTAWMNYSFEFITFGLVCPKVKLEFTLGKRGPWESFIVSFFFCKF